MLEASFGTSAQNLLTGDSKWFFLLYRMSNCVECHHVIKAAASHERCRTHADCARGPLYYGAHCGVCQALWARARDFVENPDDALVAFKSLLEWTAGFCKNSKGRQPGVSYFADASERKEFESLRTRYNRIKRGSSVESSRSSIPSQRVSFI